MSNIRLTKAELAVCDVLIRKVHPATRRGGFPRTQEQVVAEWRAVLRSTRALNERARSALAAQPVRAAYDRLSRNPAFKEKRRAALQTAKEIWAAASAEGLVRRTSAARRELCDVFEELMFRRAGIDRAPPDAHRLAEARAVALARAQARAPGGASRLELAAHFRGGALNSASVHRATRQRLIDQGTVVVEACALALLETAGGADLFLDILCGTGVVGLNVHGLSSSATWEFMPRFAEYAKRPDFGVRCYYLDETLLPNADRWPLKDALKLARRADIASYESGEVRLGARWLQLEADEWDAITKEKCEMGGINQNLGLRDYADRVKGVY